MDEILHGGLPAGRTYLLEGTPGSGKTTIGMQFLLEGVRLGQPCLYITLSEGEAELRAVAGSHGWSLDGVEICEPASVTSPSLESKSQYTMFHPAEVELNQVNQIILEVVQRVRPQRVVVDSLPELRLLAQSSLRHRRQVLGLRRLFKEHGATALFLDDRSSPEDVHLRTAAHGVILLDRTTPEFGLTRRRLQVLKMRGMGFADSYHDFIIRRGGMQVFPRLVAVEHEAVVRHHPVSSGIAELDTLCGGGLPSGSSTLILGPAGCGKSTVATQYALAAVRRGECASIFLFEESLDTFLARSASQTSDLSEHVRSGRIRIRQVDPGSLSPGEFSVIVRSAVEKETCAGSTVLIIDSLNGYLNAMPEERFLMIHLHELLTYLGRQDVLSLLIMAQHGVVGASVSTPLDATYLADNVILLRYFEAAGQIRKALSVVKRRSGAHESSIREFMITSDGIRIGPSLTEFQGVLTGIPQFLGVASSLLKADNGLQK